MPHATTRSPRRRVALPEGRTLQIRPATFDDADGLEALYSALDADDRYRRFFTAGFRPPRRFFEKMASAAERGGAELVATVDGDESETIVGECGYVLLPNGDGELAMTVAEAWRGWLGPYLLDALVDTAATNDVPNLEADVLVMNRPMIAIAMARGSVIMDHTDVSTIRVLIGTTDRAPTWPGDHAKRRVLVEGVGTWHAEEAARQAGLDVLICPGPGRRARTCPLIAGRPCPLAAGADAIVISRPDDGGSQLVAAHRQLTPGVPVCVEPATDRHATNCCAAVPDGDDAVVVGFVQRLAGEHSGPLDALR